MIEPRYMPLIGYAEAWSASTAGELSGAPIVVKAALVEESNSIKALEQQERMLVEIAVKRNVGNLDRAAAELGIGRTTLWRKMKRYGIDKNQTM